jgi:cytidylate kinase
MKLLIALDGVAASGKGTLAKRLAAHFQLPHLDTGLLYRAVGVYGQGKSLTEQVDIALSLTPLKLENEALRSAKAGELASKIAVIPEVRAALLKLQHDFAKNKKGAVLDGRDIGTVILPNAPYKFYITASPEIRAERRALELEAKGEAVSRSKLIEEIVARDARDSSRSNAPLLKAADAYEIDTSFLTIEEGVKRAIDYINVKSDVRKNSKS